MEITLQNVNIVLLADAHNPSILSPQWIREKLDVKEKYKEFVNTPQFSLFDAEKFVLIVDSQRLQLTIKKNEENEISQNNLEYLYTIAAKYVKTLPHIPYNALGLNFIFTTRASTEEENPEISTNIKFVINTNEIERKHKNVRYGSIIYDDTDD